MASDLNGLVMDEFVYSNLENVEKNKSLSKVFYDDNGNIKQEFKDNPQYKELVNYLESYKSFYSSTLDKWEIAGNYKNDATGYYSLTFYNRETNELFIANRGTESGKDVAADISMHIGNNIPMQFYDAEASYINTRETIAKRIESETGKKPEIIVSGQSLGASESDYQFARFYGDGYLSGSFTANEYGTKRLFYSDRIELYDKKGQYFDANAEYLNELKRALVNPFDPVSAFSSHWGDMVNPYSENGEYTKSANLNALFHKINTWKICNFDTEGNIIYGSINQERAKKVLESLAKERGKQGYSAPENLTIDNFLSQLDSMLFDANAGSYSCLSIGALNAIMGYRAQMSSVQGAYRDPLAVDLDGDGVESISQQQGVYFDLDENGAAEKTGWIKGDDGLLVRDINEDGKITDGGELFGDQTVMSNGKVAQYGFEALGDLDSNKDRIINAEDENFSEIKVWQDKNQDGISQAEELQSLTDAGIKKIHLDYLTVNADDQSSPTHMRGYALASGIAA